MELAYKWITLANRYYYQYLNRALEPCGVNSSQYLFILNICRAPGITQDKLPERICVNKSNVTRALGQLEKKGFILRKPNLADKRTTNVFPTQQAYEAYPKIMEIIAAWDEAVTSVLAPQDRDALLFLLQRVADRAREVRDTPPEAAGHVWETAK